MPRLCIALSLLLAFAASAAPPSWVARSNAHAEVLLGVLGDFAPEQASALGLAKYDARVVDLGPDLVARRKAALESAKAELARRAAAETDPRVRQDLELMIDAAMRQLDSVVMEDRYTLPYTDVPKAVFTGVQRLTDAQLPASRRAKAIERLRAYAGLAPDTTALTELARARFMEGVAREPAAGDPPRMGPMRAEVEQALANTRIYVDGLKRVFVQHPAAGADEALAALERQFADYDAWVRAEVLPRARTDAKLPRDYYAYRLRQVGIDVAPEVLIERAQLEFMETRAAMQQLAPIVAQAHGIDATDYRDVIRALKKQQLGPDDILPFYRTVLDALDRSIAKGKVVDLPRRPMQMKIQTDAESAANPAPNFRSAPLVGNTGEQGQFMLPLSIPGEDALAYDDFTYKAAAWTLSAHEARPGHELQFTSLLERGVSLARAALARNSVNTEGWALYAEAEMVPYEPVEGQLVALQFRLLRAARAILDPSLNLGLTTRERGRELLTEDVVLSEAMAKQELDRYQFRAPGQAGAYFYGYTRILQLRMETELALGDRFDRLAYNNFLVDQGTLPPDLLQKAVREQFVPKYARRDPRAP
jgi:uncharacterized protein (DUF885 family)